MFDGWEKRWRGMEKEISTNVYFEKVDIDAVLVAACSTSSV